METYKRGWYTKLGEHLMDSWLWYAVGVLGALGSITHFNPMETEYYKWHKLSEKCPQLGDCDGSGYILVYGERAKEPVKVHLAELHAYPNSKHWWFPWKLPEFPTLEKTQEEKDREWAKNLRENWGSDFPFMAHCFGERCINYGRADERKRLAADILEKLQMMDWALSYREDETKIILSRDAFVNVKLYLESIINK